MTEKLSAFIDDALYTQEVKLLLNELASDNNRTTLELYLLTREILQNNHSLLLKENLSERILQSIRQEMQKNSVAFSSNSKKRLLWRPSFAIAAVFMLGVIGTTTWWSTKTSPENQASLTAVSDLTTNATLSTVSSESADNNQLTTTAQVAEADNTDTSSKPASGEQDGFSLDPYLFAHQELAPMGGFQEPLPYVRTVSGTK